MSLPYVLNLGDGQATLEAVGGKGASLARLSNADFPVPEGFHISTAAYRRFVDENSLQPIIEAALQAAKLNRPTTLEAASQSIRQAFMSARLPADISGAIAGAYADLSGQDPAVAVRSSATAEDLPQASFAGQQESYLNVRGAEQVLEAVQKCWASLWTARAIGYRLRQGIDAEGVALAVVVQLLVPAEVAGILFTANPINGNREQALINASWGLGDAVVGGRVTPDDYIMDKAALRVISRSIADKALMTVRTNRDIADQPVPETLRTVPALDDHDLIELTRLGLEIEALYGAPMDIEWALADGRFAIVQARPITALDAAKESWEKVWPLPDPKARYMRASIVDLMPDPLSPLFATMGLPGYNRNIQKMLGDMTGVSPERFPPELVVQVRDYAYMPVSYTLGEWWAMLAGLAPRLIGLIRRGPAHFREVALPEYRAKVEALSGPVATEMSATDLWRQTHELMAAAWYQLSVLQVDTLGAAAGSEGLFSVLYGRFAQREADPPPPTFLMGYDTVPMQVEKSLFDMAVWAREDPGLAECLRSIPADQLISAMRQDSAPAGVASDIWSEWIHRFDTHLAAYGHLFYDLDFVHPVPADDPAPLLQTIKMYLRGEGVNPHERLAAAAERRSQAEAELLGRLRGLRGWAVRKALGWAQALAQVREDSYASIGLAYPRLRRVLLELGRRLAAAGAIEHGDDIFWLETAEVEKALPALEAGESLPSMMADVRQRRTRIKEAGKLIPPVSLPPSKTYMGIPVEFFVPSEAGLEANRLKGVGASSGRVTGQAFVLHGPEDFDQMQPGGILVAKMTTPAWTPLFAMASAVVTDIGGPLSHGSIVAREYGIPAVLGTGAATRLIQTGQHLTVDGDAGEVILLSESA
jgi:phosphohistidine swiveling domain-containing protein